jgi:lipopolysaccharide/colanic/teichoic acid biosynthesis glycosyltransferase
LTPRVAQRSEQLNRLLERERARADRSGLEMSLLLIGLDGRPPKGIDLPLLLETVGRRCRITDEAGRFDRRSLYVMLPDTRPEGARHFAETIQAAMSRRGAVVSFAIYSYRPVVQDDDQSPGDRGQGRPKALSAGTGVARRLPAPAAKSISVAAQAGPALPLDQALVRRLPAWKRAMDLAVAGAMLVLLWPLLVTIGLAVKLESPGPAIFRQRRTGLGGKTFEILKFRTMCDNAESQRDTLLHINEQDGPAFKIRHDPRVTRVGAFLRRTSLDELPQLINVLRGEMTLVGPRPLPCRESDGCVGWQRRRLDVTPGLTCIWQVSGRSTVNFDEWVRMDLAYKRRFSLWHDLRILFATIPAVLTQRGAH